MAFKHIQSEFTGGEIVRRIDHRIDNDGIKRGLAKCVNMIPTPEGSVTKRPGTKFVAEFGYPGRLIPYLYDVDQEYMMLLSEQKLEFIKDGNVIGGAVPLAGVLTTEGFATDTSGGTAGTTFSMDGWLGTPYTVSGSSVASFPIWNSGNTGQFLGGGIVIERVTRATKPFTLVNTHVYRAALGVGTASTRGMKIEVNDSTPTNAAAINQVNQVNGGTTIVSHGISSTNALTSTQNYWFANQSADLSRFISWRSYGGSPPNLTSFALEHVGFHVHRNLFQTDLSSWVNIHAGNPLNYPDIARGVHNSQVTTPNHNEAAYVLFQTSNNVSGLELAGITRQITFPYAGEHTLVVAVTQETTAAAVIDSFRMRVGTTAGAGDISNAGTDILAGVAANARWQNTHTDGLVTYVPFVFTVPSPGSYFVTLEAVDTFDAAAPSPNVARIRLAEVIIYANALTGNYSVTVPYSNAQLCDVGHTQAVRTLFLTHQEFSPLALRRNVSADTWELVAVDTLDGAYLDTNLNTGLTITPSAATGNITLTASAPLFDPDDAPATWKVARWVRLFIGSQWGAVRINGYTSSTVVSATVAQFFPLGGTTATSLWRMGAFSGEQGYPARCAFWDNRFWFARTKGQPGAIFGSIVNGVASELGPGDTWATVIMSPTLGNGTVSDDRGFTRIIGDKRIEALVPAQKLQVLTNRSEHALAAGNTSGALSPTNTRLEDSTYLGTPTCTQPVRTDDKTIFVQRDGQTVRLLADVRTADGFVSQILSRQAQHLIQDANVKELAYTQAPFGLLWVVKTNGQLLSLTYDTNNNTYGWAQHRLGGSFQGGAPRVISIATLYDDVKKYDMLHLLVHRTINGVDKYVLEVMEPPFINEGLGIEDAHFVDCGRNYVGVATNVASASWLTGESVQIVANGVVIPSATVVGGEVSVPAGTTKAHVGYGYEANIETLEAEYPSQTGSLLFHKKQIADLRLKVYLSGLCRVGFRDPINNTTVVYDAPYQPTFDQGFRPTFYTGLHDKITVISAVENTKGSVVINSNIPHPLTIDAISFTLKLADNT